MPPDTTAPATATPIVGTKETVLAKVESFFKALGKDIVIDYDDVKADIEALFIKHVKPATTNAVPPPATTSPPVASTPAPAAASPPAQV